RRCFLGCILSVNCRRFGSVRSRAIGGNLARCPFLLFRLRLGRGYGRCVSQIRTSFCRLGLGFCRLACLGGAVILGLPGLSAAPPLRSVRERLFGRLSAHTRGLHSFRRCGLLGHLGHSFCRGFLPVARMRFGVDGLITFAAVALATSLAAAALLRRASFARLIGGREFADIRFGGLCHIAVRLIAGGVVEIGRASCREVL